MRLGRLLPRAVVIALIWVLATAAFTFAADRTQIIGASPNPTPAAAQPPELTVPKVPKTPKAAKPAHKAVPAKPKKTQKPIAHKPAKKPAAKAPAKRPPAFEAPRAPREPLDEITLPARADQLATWIDSGPKRTN